MTVTAKKHALRRGIAPGPGKMMRLLLLEISAIISWTVLFDAVIGLLSDDWITLLPVSYCFAAILLAWLESGPSRGSKNNPLEALGLGEVRLDGGKPGEWHTFRRVFATPLLVLLFGAGLVPVTKEGLNLIQLFSGTRIVPVDENMDPRPDDVILSGRKKALFKVVAYTLISFLMAALITFVPLNRHNGGSGEKPEVDAGGLSVTDRKLLAGYLEMKALFPDCLEARVRLASLYYRNDMKADLELELEGIRRLDPDHAILLLEEDLSVSMEDLLCDSDSIAMDSAISLPVRRVESIETTAKPKTSGNGLPVPRIEENISETCVDEGETVDSTGTSASPDSGNSGEASIEELTRPASGDTVIIDESPYTVGTPPTGDSSGYVKPAAEDSLEYVKPVTGNSPEYIRPSAEDSLEYAKPVTGTVGNHAEGDPH